MKQNSLLKAKEICEKISKISIYVLVFLLPLFFLPWTASALGFNKQALLVVLVFISLFALLLKILISGDISLDLNKFHIPVLVLFSVYLLSTFFSLWRYGSFWGWPQTTAESFLSLLVLIILYFLVVNIYGRKEILYLMLLMVFSGFLAVLFGVLQIFGKFIIPLNFTKITSFNSIGTVNSLGVFAAILLPLLIILVIRTKKFLRISAIVALVLSTTLLVLINYSMIWWLVAAGAVLLIIFGTQKREFFDNRWLILPMFFLALALFFSLFNFQISGIPQRAIELFLTYRSSLDITSQALKDNLILGTGPGTFVYNFAKYKDAGFNQNIFWNTRFETANVKAINLLAETGVLGFLSFLALAGFFIFLGIKFFIKGKTREKKSENETFLWALALGIFVSFIVLNIGFFLYKTNLSLEFIYFLLMAGFIALISEDGKKFVLKPSSLLTLGVTFIITLVFVFGLGVLILEGQRYAAEVVYLKAVKSFNEQRIDEAVGHLEKAIRINPKSDLYWRELSQIYFQKIQQEAMRTDLSSEEFNRNLQILVTNTVDAANAATSINPKNVINWSVRGFTYQNLSGLAAGVREWAIKCYDEALKLEPVNPYFLTQKGIVLLTEALSLQEKEEKEKILLEAKEQFEKAIELKSDYAPAHFQRAMVYQAQGRQAEVIEQLEQTKALAPSDVGLAFQLGLVYYQNKEYDEARAELERAVALSPNYSNALYFLGLTYDILGDKSAAIEKFEKLVELNPGNEQVDKVLENLKAGKKALTGVEEKEPPQIPIEETPPEIEE